MFYNFEFNCSNMIFGENSIEHIPKIIKQRFDMGKILILTDENLVKIGLVRKIEKILKDANIKFILYDKVLPEPSTEVANKAGNFARENKVDIIISFGGGSVLDIGKTTAMLLTNHGRIEDYIGVGKIKNIPVPMIAIPTTAGTGSQVTMSAVITMEKEEKKSGVQSPLLVPSVSIIDPTLTYDIPKNITALTAIDAFSHALESFLAKKASYVSDLFAMESFKMFYNSVRQVYVNGTNYEARNNICLSSHLAGISMANAGAGIIHSTAHVLGAKYHISHGMAIASTIYPCSKFNLIGNPEKFAKVANIFKKNIKGLDKIDAGFSGVQAIKEILKDLNLDLKAKSYGAKNSDINDMAEKVIADKRLTDNNVRNINIDEVKYLFKEIIG